jgi:hypothetical protein
MVLQALLILGIVVNSKIGHSRIGRSRISTSTRMSDPGTIVCLHCQIPGQGCLGLMRMQEHQIVVSYPRAVVSWFFDSVRSTNIGLLVCRVTSLQKSGQITN